MSLSEQELYEIPLEDLRALVAAKTVRKLLLRALLVRLVRLPKKLDFISPLCRKLDIELAGYITTLVDRRFDQRQNELCDKCKLYSHIMGAHEDV